MSKSANEKAVEALKSICASATKGGDTHKAAIEALGLAGGIDAVEALKSICSSVPKGGDTHKAAIRALGMAGRNSSTS